MDKPAKQLRNSRVAVGKSAAFQRDIDRARSCASNALVSALMMGGVSRRRALQADGCMRAIAQSTAELKLGRRAINRMVDRLVDHVMAGKDPRELSR